MAKVKEPNLVVLYDGVNITTEINEYLISFTYTDKVQGAADECELVVDDSRQLWKGGWFPDKSSKLTVDFGYVGRMVRAGIFQIDEVEFEGSPDTCTMRALSAGIKSALRTKSSFAHEDKTLRQIAQVIAQKHGLTIDGNIADIHIKRATQNRETDLSFLHRIASEYGFAFSVRDSVITFTDIYELEGAEPVEVIDKSNVASYSFKDTTNKTYKSARVKHHNPDGKTAVEAAAELGILPNGGGGGASSDTLEIRDRVEDKQQAERKAKAHLHKHNSRGVTGTLTLDGNPFLVAGINITITGFGELDGIWHIEESKHTISKNEGYITELSIKRISKS